MLLSLNDQLRLAKKEEVLAQNAANIGDFMRTALYIEKATEHLDRYDTILKLVNPMLLERFEESIHIRPPGAAEWMEDQWMQENESAFGPVSTTLRERLIYQSISREARISHRLQNLYI